MKKTYLFRETQRVRKALNENYDIMLEALKVKKPKAESLTSNEIYSMAHTLLSLLVLGQIQVKYFNDDGIGRYIGLTVKED